MASGKHVIQVGAGGNIGSQITGHLARTTAISTLTLVDPDRYDESNLAGQAIDRADVGRTKVSVQARVARRIRPDLDVRPIADRVENVPLGLLRADILICATDSMLSRIYCNEIALRLGMPLVDSAVLAAQSLVRVSVHLASDTAGCIECGYGADDYAHIDIERPCLKGRDQEFSTAAPSYLGGVSAALAAAECVKLLEGDSAHSLAGKQLVLGLRPNTQVLTRLTRNPACRFDHKTWRIEELPETILDRPLSAILTGGSSIGVFGGRFVLRTSCRSCGRAQPAPRLVRSGQDPSSTCRGCGEQIAPTPFDWTDRLTPGNVGRGMRRTLRSAGVRPFDVISTANAACPGEEHFLVRDGSVRGASVRPPVHTKTE